MDFVRLERDDLPAGAGSDGLQPPRAKRTIVEATSEDGWVQQGGVMSKRWAGFGAAVALLALVVSIIGPAAATKGDGRLTFTVIDRNSDDAQNVTLIDVGPAGFSIGDYFVLGADPVFNPEGTREVGVVTGDCLIVHVNAQTLVTTLECDATFAFSRKGSITVEGPVSVAQSGEESGRIAITGGTEQFKTAHGEVELAPTEGGLRFTFHVIL